MKNVKIFFISLVCATMVFLSSCSKVPSNENEAIALTKSSSDSISSSDSLRTFKIIVYGVNLKTKDSTIIEASLQIFSDSIKNSSTVLTYHLVAGVNTIKVNKTASYLSVTKLGYSSWGKEYTQNEMNKYTSTPLPVYLHKINSPIDSINHPKPIYYDSIQNPIDSIRIGSH